jgi:hypothetical protein
MPQKALNPETIAFENQQFISDENEVFIFLAQALEAYRGEGDALFFFAGHHLAPRARFCGISNVGDGHPEKFEPFKAEVRSLWRSEAADDLPHKRLVSVCKKLLASKTSKKQNSLVQDLVPSFLSGSFFNLKGTHLKELFKLPQKPDNPTAYPAWPSIIQPDYSNLGSTVTEDNAPTFVAEYLYFSKQTRTKWSYKRNPLFSDVDRAPTLLFLPLAALGQTRAAGCWMTLSSDPAPDLLETLRAVKPLADRLYTSLLLDLFVVQLAAALAAHRKSRNPTSPQHPVSICQAFAYLWLSEEMLLVSKDRMRKTIGHSPEAESIKLEFSSDPTMLQSHSELHDWFVNHPDPPKRIIVNKIIGEKAIVAFPFRELSTESLAEAADVDVAYFLCHNSIADPTEFIGENLLSKKMRIFVDRELESNERHRMALAAGIAHEVKNTTNPLVQKAITLKKTLYRHCDTGPESEAYHSANELQRELLFLSASTLALDLGLKKKYADLRSITSVKECRLVIQCALSLANTLVQDPNRVWREPLMNVKQAAKTLSRLLNLGKEQLSSDLDDVLGNHLAVLHIIPFIEPLRNMEIHHPTSNKQVYLAWSFDESNHKRPPALILEQRQEERSKLKEDQFSSTSLARLYSLLGQSLGFKKTELFYDCRPVADHYEITYRLRIEMNRFWAH